MAELQIILADELKTRLQARAAESGYESVEGYVAALVRADLETSEADDAELEAMLLHRLDSGPGVEFTPEFAEQFKREVRQRRESNGRQAS
jgi:plasmid stability protein